MEGVALAPQNRVTIKDVALKAGVSTMTVSRALHDSASVTQATKSRVLAAVQELGYSRNENARSLRPGHSSNLIGLTVTDISNPYYGEFVVGVEDVFDEHGKRVILGNTAEDQVREAQLLSDFAGRQVDGAIVVPAAGVRHDHLQSMADRGMRMVLASRSIDGLDIPSVVLADFRGAYDATVELIRSGHTRVCFVGWAEGIYTAVKRYAGFAQAMNDHGIDVDPAYVIDRVQGVEEVARTIQELLEGPNPPTAFFSANNRHHMGVFRAALHHRESLPSSFAMVSFDDFELAGLSPFPVIIVSHDPREMGRTAAEMLLDPAAESYRELAVEIRRAGRDS